MTRKIIKSFAVLTVVLLSFAILANSMTKPLGRDEQMYCSAGVLLAEGKVIYRDFSYVAQMPYHPLLYAGLFKILNTSHYLLVGRMVSAFCDILVVVCIVAIFRHIFSSFPICGLLFGLAGAVLYVFNPTVDYANGFAWNHDVVILCAELSFWLFLFIDFTRRWKYLRIAGIGALLTFATCMRITTALVQLLFLALLLMGPAASVKQRLKAILPFLIATAAVLIWPLWIIAPAWRAFFLNVFRIPALNGEWLHQIGMVHNKLGLTVFCLMKPGYLALIVLTIYFYLATGRRLRKLKVSNAGNLLLAALLPVIFFIIAFIPPTMWRQYLAMPVPFLIISLAFPLLYLRRLADKTGQRRHFNVAAALVATCVLAAPASYSVVLCRVPQLFELRSWTPIRLHKISEDIAERTKGPKLILTLAPLYALEGRCGVYTEFSAGSFVYRISDFMSSSERAVTHTAGPKTLGALLEKSPPSAVIVGVDLEFLEEPLLQAAVTPDRQAWERKVYEDGPVVYFRR